MVTVYVLELSDNKYYVGKSNNPDIRIKEHFLNNGSVWTTKYKPLNLIEKYENCDDFDEDKYVKVYMMRHGIENVRGGSYSQIILEPSVIDMLNKELCSATDKCFTCGLSTHFTKECRGKEMEEMYYELNNNEDIIMDIELTDYGKIYKVERYVTYYTALHKLPSYYIKHQKDSLNNIILKIVNDNKTICERIQQIHKIQQMSEEQRRQQPQQTLAGDNTLLSELSHYIKMIKCLHQIIQLLESTETTEALCNKYEHIFKCMIYWEDKIRNLIRSAPAFSLLECIININLERHIRSTIAPSI